jgi:hypothetical protein
VLPPLDQQIRQIFQQEKLQSWHARHLNWVALQLAAELQLLKMLPRRLPRHLLLQRRLRHSYRS